MSSLDDAAALIAPTLPEAAARSRAGRRKPLWLGIAVMAVIVVASVAFPIASIQDRNAALQASLQQRLQTVAAGRRDVIETWLDGQRQLADRVADAEIFRLFATEMAIGAYAGSSFPVPESVPSDDELTEDNPTLAEQLPYMAQLLTDFVLDVEFLAGYLINRDGVAYVTSGGAPALTAAQKAAADGVLASGGVVYGAARTSTAGLVMDLYVPVIAMGDGAQQGKPVAVLMFAVPVGGKFAVLLQPGPLWQAGERLTLVQRTGDTLTGLSPDDSDRLVALSHAHALTPAGPLAFARRPALDGRGEVYSAGYPVDGTSWWVVQEVDVAAAERDLDTYVAVVGGVAALVVAAVVAAFVAFWWRLNSHHNRAIADQYRRLAATIEAQRRLLDSINGTIVDHIGLKDRDGAYVYANQAFADAVGRPVDAVTGMDDRALFGQSAGERLAALDRKVLAEGSPVTAKEEIYLHNRKRHLQISKVPYRGESDEISGVVSVNRDVTELVEAEERRARAVKQTVAALVRAIEFRDPYLAGHSRRVAGFAAAVVRQLGDTEADQTTVEVAANVSQIGKLSVPRDILQKPERLSAAEIKVLEGHVDHAHEILREIPFDLPVVDTVYQMYERLDGSGYPRGLAADAISRPARVLAVCDVFCARVAPRSYRAGITPAEALAVLTDNADRYDSEIVAAMRDVVASTAGEKLLADLTDRLS